MDEGRCSFPYILHPFIARLVLKREATGNQYYRPKEGNVVTIRTSLELWVGWRKIQPPPPPKRKMKFETLCQLQLREKMRVNLVLIAYRRGNCCGMAKIVCHPVLILIKLPFHKSAVALSFN